MRLQDLNQDWTHHSFPSTWAVALSVLSLSAAFAFARAWPPLGCLQHLCSLLSDGACKAAELRYIALLLKSPVGGTGTIPAPQRHQLVSHHRVTRLEARRQARSPSPYTRSVTFPLARRANARGCSRLKVDLRLLADSSPPRPASFWDVQLDEEYG